MTSPIRRRTVLRRSLGSAAMLAAPWPFHVRAAALQTIRIGVANAPVGNPPMMSSATSMAVTHAKRWIEDDFAHDGVKIDWIFFKGTGPAVNEALTNDQLDFAYQGDLPALIGRASNLRTRVLMSVSSRTNVYVAVPADSPARSIADLRGKRVAFAKGTMSQLPANRLLDAAKLSERDLRVVSLDSATQLAALATKDIDAVFSGAVLLKQRNSGLTRIVGSTRATPGLTGQSLLLVTERFAQEQPAAVSRVARAVVRGADWAGQAENREATLALWARGGIPAEVWREEFDGDDFAARLGPVLDPFLTARLKQSVDDAQRYKLIRRGFDVETWIDRAPVQSALKALKLEGRWKTYGADGRPISPPRG